MGGMGHAHIGKERLRSPDPCHLDLETVPTTRRCARRCDTAQVDTGSGAERLSTMMLALTLLALLASSAGAVEPEPTKECVAGTELAADGGGL